MRYKIALLLSLALPLLVVAQKPNVLFIGNSYTEVNSLPQMVSDVARSMGDDFSYSANTPGGCTFMQHCSNHSMELIRQGGWDVVVLQEQSQYPSFPQSQVENEVFPYAERLVDSVYAHSPCAEPMFYMTWGRRDGDQRNAQYFPVLGTYEGMDSMLCERYTYMAEAFDAALCPVGRVWRLLRRSYPQIELYQSDGSHPSLAGTYAAACAFYTMIFHRDPDSIGYNPGLPDDDALAIRSAVHTVVYEHLASWQRPMPTVALDTLGVDSTNTVWFAFESSYADSLVWDFGDGSLFAISADDTLAVSHTYADTGRYTVTLTALRHCLAASATVSFSLLNGSAVGFSQCDNDGIALYPNPFAASVTLHSSYAGAVHVVNSVGMTVYRAIVLPGTVELPLSGLPAGVYTVCFSTPQGILSRTLVKR